MLFANQNREVSEWLKELAWKASIWVTVSRVRIPSSLREIFIKDFKILMPNFTLKNVRLGFFTSNNCFNPLTIFIG